VSGRWRLVALPALVSVTGAAGAGLVAILRGVGTSEVGSLLRLLVPAAVVTLLVAFAVRPVLRRATLAQQFAAVAALAVVFALANLAVLTAAMFVNRHDATLLAALLVYSLGVSAAAAIVLARSGAAAVRRLRETATRLGDGDLTARTGLGSGRSAAGHEITTLASTLDDMAARLERAEAEHRQVEAVRRDLVTAVSHDLRTPLANLRAMVEAVADDVVDDPDSLRRYAVEMRDSVAQISGLVDDLFEFAQLEAGAVAAETRRASVREMVDSALAAVTFPAAEKGLRLVTQVDGAGEVACSPRLERVLHNLLVNAVRHTPHDGTVRVHATVRAQRLELEVEDSGEGIRPEDLGRLFEPFFRGDPARHGPGAGLGLAVAQRIVEALGGRITAESRPTGARFAVSLPV
jgi:signal transduction histidine kinase